MSSTHIMSIVEEMRLSKQELKALLDPEISIITTFLELFG